MNKKTKSEENEKMRRKEENSSDPIYTNPFKNLPPQKKEPLPSYKQPPASTPNEKQPFWGCRFAGTSWKGSISI